MIRNVDIAWLAGLLEGEGSFGMSGRSITIVANPELCGPVSREC